MSIDWLNKVIVFVQTVLLIRLTDTKDVLYQPFILWIPILCCCCCTIEILSIDPLDRPLWILPLCKEIPVTNNVPLPVALYLPPSSTFAPSAEVFSKWFFLKWGIYASIRRWLWEFCCQRKTAVRVNFWLYKKH